MTNLKMMKSVLREGKVSSSYRILTTACCDLRSTQDPRYLRYSAPCFVKIKTSKEEHKGRIKDLPGDSLGVIPSDVLDNQTDPGVDEENPGHLNPVVLETEEEGDVPGLVPRVLVHAGVLA